MRGHGGRGTRGRTLWQVRARRRRRRAGARRGQRQRRTNPRASCCGRRRTLERPGSRARPAREGQGVCGRRRRGCLCRPGQLERAGGTELCRRRGVEEVPRDQRPLEAHEIEEQRAERLRASIEGERVLADALGVRHAGHGVCAPTCVMHLLERCPEGVALLREVVAAHPSNALANLLHLGIVARLVQLLALRLGAQVWRAHDEDDAARVGLIDCHVPHARLHGRHASCGAPDGLPLGLRR